MPPMNLDREPILTRGAAVSGITAILAVIVAFGVPVSPAQHAALVDLVAIAGPAAATAATWWWARRHTTVLTDPRNNAGEPLESHNERVSHVLKLAQQLGRDDIATDVQAEPGLMSKERGRRKAVPPKESEPRPWTPPD